MADFTINGENGYGYFDVPSDYTPLVFDDGSGEKMGFDTIWEEQRVWIPLRHWTEKLLEAEHYRSERDHWRAKWAEENDRAAALQGDLERLRSDVKAAAGIDGEED